MLVWIGLANNILADFSKKKKKSVENQIKQINFPLTCIWQSDCGLFFSKPEADNLFRLQIKTSGTNLLDTVLP